MEPLLQMSGISKAFFGVPVLKSVDIELAIGKTLGLVGENGAGKSTLMNILGGNLLADHGRMQLAATPYAPKSPRDAETAGVAFIHQELNLFPNLTIAENLFLSGFPKRWGCIDRRATLRKSRELLAQVGLDLSPHWLVEGLSAGERQLVEIAKALRSKPKVLILDEPTTSLTLRESERLFELLGKLQRQGMSMIFISHALGDVLRLCDCLAVLRDGILVATGPAHEFNVSRLVSAMVGRDTEHLFPPRTSQPLATVALEALHLSQPGVIHEISFALHHGEVLGISGLMGSGRTELARILFGLNRCARGRLELEGEEITGCSVRRRIALGMALLTESRREDGLCMPASIVDNASLVAGKDYTGKWCGGLSRRRMRQALEPILAAVHLNRTARADQAVQTLSGGNQQKVVLAKWLLAHPRVFLLDEPTRGIDVGAKYEIYNLIDRLAAEGVAILVISSELEELIGICDRILVMSQGEIRDELPRSAFDRDRIMQASLTRSIAEGLPSE